MQIETHKKHFHALAYILRICSSTHNRTNRRNNKDTSKHITRKSSLFPEQQLSSNKIHMLSSSDVIPLMTTIQPGRKIASTKRESAQRQRPTICKGEAGKTHSKRSRGSERSWEGIDSNWNKKRNVFTTRKIPPFMLAVDWTASGPMSR